MPSSYRYHLLVLTSAFTSWTSSAIVFRSISTARRSFLTPAFVTNQPFFPRIFPTVRNNHPIHRSIMSHHGNNDAVLPEITFDKSQFDRTIELVALNIPAKSCTAFTTALKGWVLSRPRTKKIYDVVGDKERRLLVLSEEIGGDVTLAMLPSTMMEFIQQHDGQVESFHLQMGYDQLSVDIILRQLLPPSIVDIPSSFEQVGHIAHLNLREELLSYKHLIGHVILDKNRSNLRTVVNKVGCLTLQYLG